MKQKLWLVYSLLLVLSLPLAGCGQKITAEEIVAKMQETMESTQDAHAVVVVHVDAQGITLSATAEVWEKSPNKLRAEVLTASKPDLVGSTMVSDGKQGWYYDSRRDVVMVGTVDEIDTPVSPEMLNELQEIIQEVLDVSDVKLEGEETIAEREAYRLVVSPKEEADQEILPGNGTATLWVDKEQWIVLKATYEASVFGQGSMEIQSFEMNPGLSDDLFTYEVPEGAEVIDVQAQEPVPLTLDEAKEQAGFPLLQPEYIPEGATLIEVFKMGDSIILRYDHSAEISFAIMQGTELASPPPLGESQNITIHGQSATAITDEASGNTFLYWTENDVTVTIAGHISLSEALQVAESLK
jgi:outer membrane lipoprotein-sorting protein